MTDARTNSSNIVMQVDDLSISYATRDREVQAVRNVSFSVPSGKILGIVGESGCGKSTIAYGMVNFLGPNGLIKNGRILFQGKNLVGQDYSVLRQLRGNKIAMVFQDPMQALNPSLRLGRQLAETLVSHQGIERQEAWDKSEQMLARVHVPDPRKVMMRYPHQISGGQQQRVVIAMAMLNNPALLIMDEPTTALDVTAQAAVLDLIGELKENYDTGIIYITHDLGVVASLADSMAVMYAGELVETGDVTAVFKDPKHPYTRGLMNCVPRLGACKDSMELTPIKGRVPRPKERPQNACVFSPRCEFSIPVCDARRPDLRTFENHIKVRCHRAEEIENDWICPPPGNLWVDSPQGDTDRHPGSDLLVLQDVKKHYPLESDSIIDFIRFKPGSFVKAVDGISFEVPQRSIFGLVGESGCGKTTLIKTVLGLEKSSAGSISFDGENITTSLRKRDPEQIKNLQIVFQNPDATLNPSFSVGKQLSKPLKRFKVVPPNQIRQKVEELLRAVRLPAAYYKRLPRQLSGGEKQRVGIARALATEPKMILCDEPVSALDVSVQAAVLKMLLDVQETYDTTLLFISHDLSVVRYICDIIAVMYLGKIVEIGSAQAVTQPPYHPYTAALLSAVPVPDPSAGRSFVRLSGDVPSAITPPKGCVFHTRCPFRSLAVHGGAPCSKELPPQVEFSNGHYISCHIEKDKLYNIKIDQI